jgi:hypothetical protein
MIYIENEGALFRGFSRSWPQEVWHSDERRFVPYEGEMPKGIEWGTEISGLEAINMMMDATSNRGAEAFARRIGLRRR